VVLSPVDDVTVAKFTNRSRKRAGTGSSPPRGRRGGERGGSSRAVERCVRPWQGEEVEGGRGCALRQRRWRKVDTWCTLQT